MLKIDFVWGKIYFFFFSQSVLLEKNFSKPGHFGNYYSSVCRHFLLYLAVEA